MTNDITFKFGILTTLLLDNMITRFEQFSMKTKNVSYMEVTKPINFRKNGPKKQVK